MKVVKYNKNKHFEPLVRCLVNRSAYIPTMAEMPKLGYVTIEGNTVIAAVFLRRVEGGYGQIDGLTSNPHCSPEERHCAIDLAVTRLLEEAKKLNIVNLLCTSTDSGTIVRSEKYGFKKLPLAVLVADLNKRSI